MRSLRSSLTLYGLVGGMLASLSPPLLAAPDADNFYKGRTVTIVVGFSAGGGFDVYARLLSKHVGKYIPGQPTVIVQNMPGAGSVTAALYILDVAPKDGSVIGIFGRTVPVAPLLTDRVFDGRRFSWVGSITSEVSVCIASAKSNVKSWNDMLTKSFVAGGEGHDSDLDLNANLLKNIFGAKIRLITGYPGTNDIKPAIERGELDGVCGLSYSSLQTQYASELEQKSVNILVQVSLERHPNLPDVPFVGDYASAEQRDALRLLLEPQAMARPFAAPAGVPADRLALLRSAFDATMQDPDFLSDARRSRLDVKPMSGAAITTMVADLYQLPKEASEKAKQAISQ